MSEAALEKTVPASTWSADSIAGDIRSLREEGDRILGSATVSSESLDVYYCLRSRVFDRLRAALRFGGDGKRVLQTLMEEMLDRDCALLEKFQSDISQSAEFLISKR